MAQVFIGMGANIGNRAGNLIRALRELRSLPDIKIVQISGFYNTEPVGYKQQDDFLNAVVEVKTALSPEALLNVVQEIERKMARNRNIHWGPRTIDLDILSMGKATRNSELLTLPHREIGNRRFVLVPWSEIAADYRIPVYGKTVQQLLETTLDTSKVEIVMTSCQVLKNFEV